MADSKRIKEIRNALSKYPRLGRNELKKEVCDKLKLMSHQTFQNNLREAVKKGLVSRVEDKGGNMRRVWYSTIVDLEDQEKKIVEYFQNRIKEFDQNFSKFSNMFDTIDNDQKSVGIYLFYKFLDSLKFNVVFYNSIYFEKSSSFKKLLEHLEHNRAHIDIMLYGNEYNFKKIKIGDREVEVFTFGDKTKINDELNRLLISHHIDEDEETVSGILQFLKDNS